jgi:hypothetical protein
LYCIADPSLRRELLVRNTRLLLNYGASAGTYIGNAIVFAGACALEQICNCENEAILFEEKYCLVYKIINIYLYLTSFRGVEWPPVWLVSLPTYLMRSLRHYRTNYCEFVHIRE